MRAERPSLFTFVIVTDSHVDVRSDTSDDCWWNRMLITRSVEILRAAVEAINARRPDFVVHCGDLTNYGEEGNFVEAARILGELKAPLHFVPGNHDTSLPAGRQLAAGLLQLGGGPLYRAVRLSGWRLLLVDSAYWMHGDGSIRECPRPQESVELAVPDAELAWLRREFRRDGETPTLCFTHALMATRGAYPVSRLPGGEKPDSFPVVVGEERLLAGELRSVLKREPCVKAVFYGHGHWHDCLVQDGVFFCQTGALVEYPCEMRLVRVTRETIETEVFGLSVGDYPALSYVHEWANRWVGGRDVDRCSSHAL